MSTITQHQEDMRRAYHWGALGIVTSGLVWLAAAIVAYVNDPKNAVWTLFIGAMFIFPVGNVLDRLSGASGKHASDNPLGRLAMEGTIWMIMCLPAAYLLSRTNMSWFFPAVLMVIAGRYLTFATLYGTRLYWVLAALLAVAAYACVALKASPFVGALAGALIEIIFGIALFVWAKRKS
jgi:hypothetical protein